MLSFFPALCSDVSAPLLVKSESPGGGGGCQRAPNPPNLYGWSCVGVRLQIRLCLICVISTYSNGAVQIWLWVWSSLKHREGGAIERKTRIVRKRVREICLHVIASSFAKKKQESCLTSLKNKKRTFTESFDVDKHLSENWCHEM